MNLYILAIADGRVDEREKSFLAKFADVTHISPAEQEQWQQEVLQGGMQFVPIDDEYIAKEALAFLARMVRVDNEFNEQEQTAYICMGKALGYTEDELGESLRKYWNEDPDFERISVAPANAAAPQKHIAASILVIDEDMVDKERLEMSANEHTVCYCSMSNAKEQSETQSFAMVVFQAADHKADSAERLKNLKQIFSTIPVAFLARRDQAPQIGFLLEMGANRCFVKPLYPNELNKAIGEFLQQ